MQKAYVILYNIRFIGLFMSEGKLKKIDRDKLPLFYRLVLKIPGTDSLENFGGILWSIIVPIFLVLEFFFDIFLLLFFPFPINVVLTPIIPVAVFIVFVRINLGRFINWWNAAVEESGFEWNVEKTVQEYLSLLEKKKEKNE
jgi:hypothetical protein